MKKVAIIIQGSLTNRKGQINASLSRINALIKLGAFAIDVYNLTYVPSFLFKLLRHSKGEPFIEYQNVDGIRIHNIKLKWYLVDYLLYIKLGRRRVFGDYALKKKARVFREYDLISAHSSNPAFLARIVHDRYCIPFCITWHGSDIHTNPQLIRALKKDTICCLYSADYNFFVSNELLLCAQSLGFVHNGMVLTNGVNERFKALDESKKQELKDKYGAIGGVKIVAYVGNLIDIKNVLSLPLIFELIQRKLKKPLQFWIIGDGKLRSELEKDFRSRGVKVKMFGNQPAEIMPELMNCIDVLVLPSLNEGLPLSPLEAIACGANAVGSDAGGIPEAIGRDSVIDLKSNHFHELMAAKIIDYLVSPRFQIDISLFNWDSIAIREAKVYQSLLTE